MKPVDRRVFLKASGLSILPAGFPSIPAIASIVAERPTPATEPVVKFFGDGEFYDGVAYLEQLQLADGKQQIKVDRYGSGGAVEELEKKFEAITGKEKAIYMPSGTMANQLAIAVLSGENTKVFVQDTSHVYRDEADAAQSVFNKRLIPLAKNETYFTADTLKNAIANLDQEEVFKSGIGCVYSSRSDGSSPYVCHFLGIALFNGNLLARCKTRVDSGTRSQYIERNGMRPRPPRSRRAPPSRP